MLSFDVARQQQKTGQFLFCVAQMVSQPSFPIVQLVFRLGKRSRKLTTVYQYVFTRPFQFDEDVMWPIEVLNKKHEIGYVVISQFEFWVTLDEFRINQFRMRFQENLDFFLF